MKEKQSEGATSADGTVDQNPFFFHHDVFTPSESPSSPIDNFIPRRNITRQDATPKDPMGQSMKWAKGQIEGCLHRHNLCHTRELANPTRLIDVDSGETGVKLRDYTSLPGSSLDYAALSYCWGDYEPKCMTTRNTIQRNMDYISWDLLPQTFRDAINFTRGLRLKYLWIDSICIIQKDDDDWCREAGKMFSVYKGAKVTLVALYGADSTAGLRETTIKEESWVVANLQIGQSIIPLCIRSHHHLGNPDKGYFSGRLPLLNRAWTYQERTISPRTLFFDQGEVIYQCASEIRCECGSATDFWENTEKDIIHEKKILQQIGLTTSFLSKESIQSHGSSAASDAKSTSGIQRKWKSYFASNYSHLKVTNPRDRLAAIGAIAEQYQQIRPGSRYLAGLWSDSLLEDLIWKPDAASKGLRVPSCFRMDLGRPYNLPTWSWASFHGTIDFFSPMNTEPLAQVVEANCVYAKENRFGVLQKSKLVLRGRMLTCIMNGGRLYEASGPGLDVPARMLTHWSLDIDCEQDCSQAQAVCLFQILSAHLDRVFCLILRLEDSSVEPHILSRLGVMSYRKSQRYHRTQDDLFLHRSFVQNGTMEEIEIR
ncbi:heterokaryon incompatibility protein-domain-containing protein [Phyllosticta capitalensis]